MNKSQYIWKKRPGQQNTFEFGLVLGEKMERSRRTERPASVDQEFRRSHGDSKVHMGAGVRPGGGGQDGPEFEASRQMALLPVQRALGAIENRRGQRQQGRRNENDEPRRSTFRRTGSGPEKTSFAQFRPRHHEERQNFRGQETSVSAQFLQPHRPWRHRSDARPNPL